MIVKNDEFIKGKNEPERLICTSCSGREMKYEPKLRICPKCGNSWIFGEYITDKPRDYVKALIIRKQGAVLDD